MLDHLDIVPRKVAQRPTVIFVMVLALLAFSDICDLHERPNLISSDWIRSITCTLMELLNQILYTIVVHRNLVPETYFANCNGRYQLRQNNAVAVTLYGWLVGILTRSTDIDRS